MNIILCDFILFFETVILVPIFIRLPKHTSPTLVSMLLFAIFLPLSSVAGKIMIYKLFKIDFFRFHLAIFYLQKNLNQDQDLYLKQLNFNSFNLLDIKLQKKILLQFMNDNLARFIKSLSTQHYSSAFVQHLVDTIADNTSLSTLQEIYQLIQKESDAIITHFNQRTEDNKLIQYRNPLCFESLHHYFHTMTRGVYKKYGNDINKFKQGLKVVAKELIEILSMSTNKIVKFSETLLKDNTAKKILVYSYSKSICLSLKRLSKILEDNLLVYVCKSGSLQEGINLYEQLVLDGVKCQLINDNQIGYYMHEITCVLVGAEVILQNGAILNRAGTSMIALIAHQSRKPVYVFAESYKFLRKIFLCQRDIPQRFRQDRERNLKTISIDLTQPEHITMFCTDNGLINPEIISLELSKVLK